mgnify:CR=1 FL=1
MLIAGNPIRFPIAPIEVVGCSSLKSFLVAHLKFSSILEAVVGLTGLIMTSISLNKSFLKINELKKMIKNLKKI